MPSADGLERNASSHSSHFDRHSREDSRLRGNAQISGMAPAKSSATGSRPDYALDPGPTKAEHAATVGAKQGNAAKRKIKFPQVKNKRG